MLTRQRAHPLELRRGVARRAAHEQRRHPAPADVDRRQHLQLALDDEAKAEPVGAADDHVGQRVVDDARMADHHEDRSRAGQLEAFDLEAQTEQRADARQVAAEPPALEA